MTKSPSLEGGGLFKGDSPGLGKRRRRSRREPRKVSREIPNRWIYTSFKELETGAYSQGSQPSAVKYIYPLQFHYPAAGVTVGHTIQASFIDTPTIYGRCL
jgi:hypothetical protein